MINMEEINNVHGNSSRKCTLNYSVSCNDCRLGTLCFPLALKSDELVKLDSIVQRGMPLQKSEHLFREKDRFSSIYAVRSGVIKTYRLTDDGREQITGLYLPGEIFGMDGISLNAHSCSALALETSAVCEIPFASLEVLSQKVQNLQRHFFQLMSREITEEQQLITLLSKNNAEERIAALMLSISSRNAQRKLSATQFRLPMSRIDIGNYLGLSVETVSRVLGRLQRLKVLFVENREITILDIKALQNLAGVLVAE